MDAIEPNLAGAVIFAIMAFATCLAGVVLSGSFPLATRPDLNRPIGLALVATNVVLVAASIWLLLDFGFGALQWTSVVILSGFALLFSPGLFNIWPSRFRDGLTGLTLTAACLALMLVYAPIAMPVAA